MVRQRAPPREHTAAHCTSPSPRALPDLRDLAHCRLKVTDDDEWVLARVEQHWAGKVHLMRQRAPKGIALKVELTDAEFAKMPTALDSALDTGDELTSDLVELEDVTEYTMLHTLRERYQKDLIYTAIGPVLVSINPYKAVDTCSPTAIGAPQRTRRPAQTAPAHPFTLPRRCRLPPA